MFPNYLIQLHTFAALSQSERITEAMRIAAGKRNSLIEGQISQLVDVLDKAEIQLKRSILKLDSLGNLNQGQFLAKKSQERLNRELKKITSNLREEQSLFLKNQVRPLSRNGIKDSVGTLVKGRIPAYASLTKNGIDAVTTNVFGLVNRDALNFMANFNIQLVDDVGAELLSGIQRAVQFGITSGQSPAEVVSGLGNVVKDKAAFKKPGQSRRLFRTSQQRLELIARTEMIRAYNYGQFEFYRKAGIKTFIWQTADDERTCPICTPKDNVRFLNIVDGPPAHPQCLVGDTLIHDNPEILSVSKRWYEGDIITIKTRSGKDLTITSNHPVLTWNSGWKPAIDLTKRDKLVCGFEGQRSSSVVSDNDKDAVTTIENISHSFGSSEGMLTREVEISSPDFHGDVINNDIAIISTNSDLLFDVLNASIFQHSDEFNFILTDILKVLFQSFCSSAFLFPGCFSTTSSIVRSFDLFLSLFFGHLTPFQFLCNTSFSISNPSMVFDNVGYSPSRNREFFCDKCAGSTGRIKINNLGYGQSFGISDITDSRIVDSENSLDNFMSDRELARQITSGSSGQMFSDDIIDISVRKYSGHVYNLHTKNGWFNANGIITHNCRCWTIPGIPTNVARIRTPAEIAGDASRSRSLRR